MLCKVYITVLIYLAKAAQPQWKLGGHPQEVRVLCVPVWLPQNRKDPNRTAQL